MINMPKTPLALFRERRQAGCFSAVRRQEVEKAHCRQEGSFSVERGQDVRKALDEAGVRAYRFMEEPETIFFQPGGNVKCTR